jgi:hypothetical protein
MPTRLKLVKQRRRGFSLRHLRSQAVDTSCTFEYRLHDERPGHGYLRFLGTTSFLEPLGHYIIIGGLCSEPFRTSLLF